ncbi:MGMT family protein [Algoriphagus sp.]|uniref:MGMT family protein n=1 Tax=Algoriphagus sp. TaxID=1872435 RepID=UPI0025CD8058|nr:MGMT family protein [Algoriphagus sp.]
MKKEKPNYFELVYQVVKEIPEGRATSYGAIAHYLGLKSGARMVGYAMNAAHTMAEVPAHRVVNRQGLLTGKHHFETPTAMQEALEKEGVKVVDDQIQNFDQVFWNPETELAL